MPTEQEYTDFIARLGACDASAGDDQVDGEPADGSADAEAYYIIERVAALTQRDRLVVTTGFGMEGCVLLHMFAQTGRSVDITYLDTGVFFPETYELRDRLAHRYQNLNFVNRGTMLTMAEQAIRFGDELWRTDPDRCCAIRKIEPMEEVLRGADVWVTAITRGQSETRAGTQLFSRDSTTGVIKVAPLAMWDRARVWEYVQQHDVPYNPLHLVGYPSIACTHCTRVVAGSSITDYSRDGRWAGLGKTECGLHNRPTNTNSRDRGGADAAEIRTPPPSDTQ